MGAMSFGGGELGGGSPLSALSGLSGLAGLGDGGDSRNPHAGLVNWWSGPGKVPPEAGQGAAKAALSKLGLPYVWGQGPQSFDRSGLTQWAWRNAGVQVGDDTYAQIKEGVAVPSDQVRVGDLIFPLDASVVN